MDTETAKLIIAKLRSMFLEGTAVDDGYVTGMLEGVLHVLAQNPTNGELRTNLFHLLEPEISGIHGRGYLIHLVQHLANTKKLNLNEHTESKHEENLSSIPDFLKKSQDYLLTKGKIDDPTYVIPAEVLPIPSQSFFHDAGEMIVHLAEDLEDPTNVETINLLVSTAGIFRIQSTDILSDLRVLRTASTLMSGSGFNQNSRNIAEHALHLHDNHLSRARAAWFIYSDAYHRSNLMIEALIGFGCILSTEAPIDPETLWFESFLGIRLFRDLGFTDIARSFLVRAEQSLKLLPNGSKYSHRIPTLELQLDLSDLNRADSIEDKEVLALLSKSTENLNAVSESGYDDLAPIVMIIAQLIFVAEQQNIDVPNVTRDDLIKLMPSLRPLEQRSLDAVLADIPNADQLAALSNNYQPALYKRDSGFDKKPVSTLAAKILNADLDTQTLESLTYAIEARCDQNINSPESNLLNNSKSPLEKIISYSKKSNPVVLVAYSRSGLLYLVFEDGKLTSKQRVSTDVFSLKAFDEWRERFPYEYGLADDFNVFFTSTELLGLPVFPKDCVLIATLELQILPTNILRLGNTFIGYRFSSVVAPSISWLNSESENERCGQARHIWIAGEGEDSQGLGGLPRIAMQSKTILNTLGFKWVADNEMLQGIEAGEVLIIVAHGGLSTDGNNFSVIASEDVTFEDARGFASCAANHDLVLLFACSAGRVDRHPDAVSGVSLVTKLLSLGCGAVIAPSWPIEVAIVAPWIKAFFKEFEEGATVSQACFRANRAIGESESDDPKKCLAMCVMGNPDIQAKQFRGY